MLTLPVFRMRTNMVGVPHELLNLLNKASNDMGSSVGVGVFSGVGVGGGVRTGMPLLSPLTVAYMPQIQQ